MTTYANVRPVSTIGFFEKPVIRLTVLLLLFMTALTVRLYHITYPPHDFAAERQYQSAHIARSYYFDAQDSVPEWRKHIADINMKRMGLLLEPRILENITVFFYRIIGKESFWVPRSLSSVFWLIGGLFVYFLARKLYSWEAALFSTAFYLLLPFSILASRSFQPDPLMVMLTVISIFMIVQYYEDSSLFKLTLAAIFSATAMLAKPYSVFFLFGAFVSLGLYRHGIVKALFSPHTFMFVSISLLPTCLYYVRGIITNTGYLNELAQGSFLPNLMLKPEFWKGWLLIIGQVVGYIAFATGLAGVLVMKKGLSKALLLGLWSGYFIFGVFFTLHIHTHDYYHLPFIPVVALSIGPPGALLTKYLLERWKVTLSICFLIAVAGGIIAARLNVGDFVSKYKNALKIASSIIGVNRQFKNFVAGDFEREVEMAKEIGEIVGHSTETVFLTYNFGRTIAYNGEFSGLPWPTSFSLMERRARGLRELSKEELFNPRYLTIRTHGRYIKYTPDYFIITDFKEFDEQKDLRDFLTENFPVLSQSDDYLIFDLRSMSVAALEPESPVMKLDRE